MKEDYSFSNLVSELSLIVSSVDDYEETEHEGRQKKRIKQILKAIQVFLVKNQYFSSSETEVLSFVMEDKDNANSKWRETVEAAFENFKDGNVLELLDTIARVIRIASRDIALQPSSSRSKRAKMSPVSPSSEDDALG